MLTHLIKTGIYNVVTDGFRWRHLIFYEKDSKLSQVEMNLIIQNMDKAKSAFALYTSEHGYHVMGLTPVSTVVWAFGFKDLDMDLKGNYSGHILRCNLKPHENQELVMIHGAHDYPLADQIFNMVIRKFKMKSDYYRTGIDLQKWKSMFCLYGDKGISLRMPTFKRFGKGLLCGNPKETISGFTSHNGEVVTHG